MKFKVGQLVKWISEYDDMIVKDAGTGIILGHTRYTYNDVDHTVYQVYRNKHNDKMSFEERDVQFLQGEKKCIYQTKR